jgi:hypothetical protein
MDATTPDGITAELRRTRPSSTTSIDTVERFVEHSDDVTVSTLRRHLKAFGARLELVAVFDDEERRVPIHLGKEDPAA